MAPFTCGGKNKARQGQPIASADGFKLYFIEMQPVIPANIIYISTLQPKNNVMKGTALCLKLIKLQN